jgi:hypothetical protein
MATTVQKLHFTLDETAGALIMTIAQEHLLYGNNIAKALDTITGSLTGCPRDLALDLLRGTKVIYVIEEDGHQMFSVGDKPKKSHIDFPEIDCSEYVQRNSHQIAKQAMHIRTGLNMMLNQMRRYRTCTIDFEYSTIMKFIGGDIEDLLTEVRDNREVSELTFMVKTTKAFIEKSMKTLAIMTFMKKTWAKDFGSDQEFFVFDDYMMEAHANISSVIHVLSDLIMQNYEAIVAEEDDLKSYTDAVREIDEIAKKGIEPVDIMINWSAGWLAPDGTFYGLNGEIANMLHNQIAELLLEAGVIPDTEDNKGNPDNWLHAQGWVKVHGHNILFEGNLNKRARRGENIYMTDTQIDIICKYIHVHHKDVVYCTHQPLTMYMFKALSQGNKFKFYKDYFMGDLA